MQRAVLTILATVLISAGALWTVAIADDGGAMARLMGHDAYVSMVGQMRGVLGNERADLMIARCESEMAASAAGTMTSGGMMTGMTGTMAMMGRHR